MTDRHFDWLAVFVLVATLAQLLSGHFGMALLGLLCTYAILEIWNEMSIIAAEERKLTRYARDIARHEQHIRSFSPPVHHHPGR